VRKGALRVAAELLDRELDGHELLVAGAQRAGHEAAVGDQAAPVGALAPVGVGDPAELRLEAHPEQALEVVADLPVAGVLERRPAQPPRLQDRVERAPLAHRRSVQLGEAGAGPHGHVGAELEPVAGLPWLREGGPGILQRRPPSRGGNSGSFGIIGGAGGRPGSASGAR